MRHAHDDSCLHFPSGSVHFMVQSPDDHKLFRHYHPACLPGSVVQAAMPLAHSGRIEGVIGSAEAVLVWRVLVDKLQAFYKQRDAELRALYDREPDAFTDRVVDRFVCSVCRLVLHRPVELSCAHLLCESCWVQWLPHGAADSAGRSCPCPVCKQQQQLRDVRHSAAIQLIIEGLEVRCVNHQLGCRQQLTVGKEERGLQRHHDLCGFVTETCNECGAQLPRYRLAAHLADECQYHCDSCHRQVKTASRAEHSDGQDGFCLDAVPCPNACSSSVSLHRDDVPAHRLLCPAEQLQCAMCPRQYRRSKEADHLQQFVVEHLSNQSRLISGQQAEIAELRRIVQTAQRRRGRDAQDENRLCTPHRRLSKRSRSLGPAEPEQQLA